METACFEKKENNKNSCISYFIDSEETYFSYDLDMIAANCASRKNFKPLDTCPGTFGCQMTIPEGSVSYIVTRWYVDNETREQAEEDCSKVNKINPSVLVTK